jgi:hypothetical protein
MSTKFCLFWLLVLQRDFCEEICALKMACKKGEVGFDGYQKLHEVFRIFDSGLSDVETSTTKLHWKSTVVCNS